MDPSHSPASPRRGRPPKNPSAAPSSPVSPLEVAAGASAYELEREARIRENMARMQKLGILDLAQSLTQSAAAAARRGRPRRDPCAVAARDRARIPGPTAPARRSLRLKDQEPVSYCDLRPKKENGSKGVKSEFIVEGSKEEVYTEDHEKLLGTCQTAWTLFVDGYDKDGKRIYDQVRGKTCHQCRQKTLGHHTSCSKCQIVQGQFCGDCLFMRYGENVLEAKKNPNWICPVCRGICNCSICRNKRGWAPTGTAYRKVVSLGYKSVAHYLIATKQASANSDDSSNKLPSAKSEASCVSDHDAPVAKESLEDGETSSQAKAKENNATHLQVEDSDGSKGKSSSDSVVTSDSQGDQGNQDAGCANPSEPTPRKRKVIETPRKRKVIERNLDCVASRLRSRTKKL